jgi:2-polyprenyl-6-methoxyphenol hydroxylase-like FAD-dependent oxidoreductase
MVDPSVLIVGAGPTGLVLALWLTKQGVSVRIIDKTAEPGTTSRALAVHARTLELYEQLGLAEPVVAKGYIVPGFRLWIGGRKAARVPFEEIVSDLTPYAGLRENALYLVRPDTYVALALPAPSVDAVEHYLAKVQINPSPDQAHVAPEGST